MATILPNTVVFLFEGRAVQVRDLKEGDRFVHGQSSFAVCFFEGMVGHCEPNDRVFYGGSWRFVMNERGAQPILEALEDSSTPFSLPAEIGEYLFPYRNEIVRILSIEACPPKITAPVSGNVLVLRRSAG